MLFSQIVNLKVIFQLLLFSESTSRLILNQNE